MTSSRKTATALALLLILPSIAPAAPRLEREEPVKITYQAASQPPVAGQEFRAEVTIEIKKGWHIFSQKPEVKGIKPTKLSIDDSSPAHILGIHFPPPEKSYSEIFEKEVTFYQGKVPIEVRLKIDSDAGDQVNIEGELEYQACSGSLCLPPARKKFSGQQETARTPHF
jgi:DsbC/DsbD-like thiol-disulfide interchange protein